SRIGQLDLAKFRPVPAAQMGTPGVEPAPGGGPIAAEAGERSGLVVVRNGRVVHHALDADLEAKGVRVCGIATCEADELARVVVELVIGDNAHVRYLSVQEQGAHTWQVALQRAHLGRDASLKSSVVALGGSYARLRSESLLAGSGAESDLTAVYFGDGHQMLD